ncbi:MAG TPA: histidine kinase [Gemmatimonadaceae bacterium]|nr:histidine kinase [Gemmatimonadaceae bacterium]
MSTAVRPREPAPVKPLRVVRDEQPDAPRRLAALRVPLVVKLVGASAAALLFMGVTWMYLDPHINPGAVMVIAFVALIAHAVLVIVALRPVHDLEKLASQVWAGDYAARFRDSMTADQKVVRVGTMFNTLLDGLKADRARMRALAEEVVAVGDRERAALARELHDSTAQRLAALLLQISAVARDERDPELAQRLAVLRDATEAMTEEVRLLASSVHPRVLDDLGITAAVKKLARDTTRSSGVPVRVHGGDVRDLAPAVASVLYRVAQESVRNASTHAGASAIDITMQQSPGLVGIEVTDDGHGFDVDEAIRRRPGMGLFTMRERVSLVDGTFEIRSDSTGTTVAAAIPLATVLTRGETR